MLIINNGVPKSGSTWVHKILVQMLRPRAPADEWRNDWSNASIDDARLPDYIASGEWRGKGRNQKPVLIKMHLDHAPDLSYLQDPDIRMIVSYRNLPDSVLSWYHHQKRLDQIPAYGMELWLKRHGMTFAKRALRYREHWQNVPGVLMCRYEDMVADAPAQIARIAAHVGHPITPEEIAAIAEATQVRLKPGEAPRDGAHERTGGQSRAKEELPPDILTLLQEMDAAAARRLAGRKGPAATKVDRPELILTGVPQAAGKLLFNSLNREIDTQTLCGPDDATLPWPEIQTRGSEPVPPGCTRVHRFDLYAQTPEALEWLVDDNPDSLFVLTLRDVREALAAWHEMYRAIATAETPRKHPAWEDRDFYATATVEAFYKTFAAKRLRYDTMLKTMLDVVPADRLVLVDDRYLRHDPQAVARDLVTLSRDPQARARFGSAPMTLDAAPEALAGVSADVMDALDQVNARLARLIARRGLTTLVAPQEDDTEATAAPPVVTDPARRSEIVVVGFPKCGTTALLDRLSADDSIHTILGEDGRKEIAWPMIRDITPAPAGRDLILHKNVSYIYNTEALDWLAKANPHSLIVLCVRDPRRALVSWHKMHRSLARKGTNKGHFAYRERDFYSDCTLAEYYTRFAKRRLRYDMHFEALLSHVPAERIVVVMQERMARDIVSVAEYITALARGQDAVLADPPDSQDGHRGYADRTPADIPARIDTTLQETRDKLRARILASNVKACL